MATSTPEFDELEAADRAHMALFEGRPWRPLVAVSSVHIAHLPATVLRAFPLAIEVTLGEDERHIFRDLLPPPGFNADSTAEEYTEHFAVPRPMVLIVDTDNNSHLWYQIGGTEQAPAAVCRSWRQHVTVDSRDSIVFESPHPSGRPHQIRISLLDALSLHDGVPLILQFQIGDAYSPRYNQWGVGDGSFWLPHIRPERGDRMYGGAFSDVTAAFGDIWDQLISALPGKFYEFDLADGPARIRTPERFRAFGRKLTARQPQPARQPKPVFDGNVPGVAQGVSVAMGGSGYFVIYYPDKATANVVVVEGDWDKGLYVFVGENCVRDAENWVTRSGGMDHLNARQAARAWFVHIHNWHERLIALLTELLTQPQP